MSSGNNEASLFVMHDLGPLLYHAPANNLKQQYGRGVFCLVMAFCSWEHWELSFYPAADLHSSPYPANLQRMS